VRYLIVSDLHANLEALNAVLEQAEGAWDQSICCGDLVGYGADPNATVEWARAHCPTVVRGNHDRASTGQDDLEWFNPVARAAALWTLQALTAENADYIRALPRGPLLIEGFQVVHGSPFDEDEYVIAPNEASNAFNYLENRLAFFGHTHVQGGFIWNQSRVETIQRPPGGNEFEVMDIDPDCAYMINPGSVGQPRDGDPRAAYVLFDSEAKQVTYCRATYDVATAQRKIYEAGLPPILGDRLTVGR
jgi:predicted phosphodiesterase